MSNNLKLDSSPEKVRELAETYVSSGKYHCAESVLLSVSETLGLLVDLRYVSGFGGGLGNTKCVCGAYSGSIVALNLLYGADKRSLELTQSRAIDSTLDKAIHRFEERFKQLYNYSCCKLLTKDVVWGSPEHFKHCIKLTGDTAEIIWNLIIEIEKERLYNQKT
jgi:C_GCAxxG_C_C family probable redox protein